MPRQFNFIKSRPYSPVVLSNQRIGFNEIEPMQRKLEEYKYLQWRHHQFGVAPRQDLSTAIFQQTMNEAFRWLSENSKGPWHWKEEEVNNGHSLAVKIHIERICDQNKFKDRYCPFFTYEPDTEAQLSHLAVIKNVLPYRKSLVQWTRDNGLTVNFGTKAGCAEVEADTPDKAEKFLAEWGDQFRPVLTNGHMPKKFKKACFAADKLCASPVVIPDDFMAYLRGECHFSMVRTLPRVKTFLPNPEQACK